MSGRLFRAIDLDWPGKHYLTEDPGTVVTDPKHAAVIDSESDCGKYLVDHADECAVEIEWLPEDQQLRHLGAAELPLWEKPANWDEQFEDPINDIMACCHRHVSECTCKTLEQTP